MQGHAAETRALRARPAESRPVSPVCIYTHIVYIYVYIYIDAYIFNIYIYIYIYIYTYVCVCVYPRMVGAPTICRTSTAGEPICHIWDIQGQNLALALRSESAKSSQSFARTRPPRSNRHPCPLLAISWSIWTEQFGEAGLVSAPKLTDLYRPPSVSSWK